LAKGRPVEAMHVLPQSVGEGIPGFSGQNALTYLEEKPIHRIADKDWIREFKDLAKADETTSARDVYDTIADSFQQSRQPQGVKDSLKLRLQDEMAELRVGPAEEMTPYRPRRTPELPPGIEELDFEKPPPTLEPPPGIYEELENTIYKQPVSDPGRVQDTLNEWIDYKYGKK